LLENFEKSIKPYTESSYKRKKHLEKQRKGLHEQGAIRNITYLQDEKFNDDLLVDKSFEDDFQYEEEVDFLKRIEKKLNKEVFLSFKVYMEIQKECKTEQGIFLKYAQRMRKDSDKVKKNTLTNWGKYQINEKLLPRIKLILEEVRDK